MHATNNPAVIDFIWIWEDMQYIWIIKQMYNRVFQKQSRFYYMIWNQRITTHSHQRVYLLYICQEVDTDHFGSWGSHPVFARFWEMLDQIRTLYNVIMEIWLILTTVRQFIRTTYTWLLPLKVDMILVRIFKSFDALRIYFNNSKCMSNI